MRVSIGFSFVAFFSTLAASVFADEEYPAFTTTVEAGIVSNYISRGLSQSQNDPAAQAGITLLHSSGAYIGAWTSSLDFGNDSRARQEIDWYGGYFWQATNDLSFDFTYFKYEYPHQSDLNLSEYVMKVSSHGAYARVNYSSNYLSDQAYIYTLVGYDLALPYDVQLGVSLGRTDYKDSLVVDKDGKSKELTYDWQVSASKILLGAKWSLSYIGTDISETECLGLMGYRDVCSPALVVGISKSFGF